MKKTLIALALAATPFIAAAEVNVYGTIVGGVEYTQIPNNDNTVTNLNDWGSKIGFRGKQKLADGFYAIWQMENKVSLDHNSQDRNKWGSGESYIGVGSVFGTLKVGHLGDSFDDASDLNIFDGNGIRTFDSTWGLLQSTNTAVKYESPRFYGFSANAYYSPEDNQRYDQIRDQNPPGGLGLKYQHDLDGFAGFIPGTNASPIAVLNTVSRNTQVISAGLNWQSADDGGFFAKYAYKRVGADLLEQYHRVIAGYKGSNWFVGGGWQTGKLRIEKKWHHQIALSGSYTWKNLTPKLGFVYTFDDENVPENTQYLQTVLAVDYAVSPRTSVILGAGLVFRDKGTRVGLTMNDLGSNTLDPGTGSKDPVIAPNPNAGNNCCCNCCDGKKKDDNGIELSEPDFSIGLGIKHVF